MYKCSKCMVYQNSAGYRYVEYIGSKALDSQDESHKCYMSLACCHEMLEESRCIYVDKVKVFTVYRTHSFLLQTVTEIRV